MEKYYKNFILCGEADYYCLLCREAFIIIEEVDKHLRWQNHRKDVKHQEYFSKFREDYIYKIADYFYCEICNLITKSATEHINDNNHAILKTSNKVSQKSSIIKRTSDRAIRINNITITKHQWHSIVDDECLLCNETVVNSFTHFASFIHIIKLIQSETLCKDNHYYRKIEKGKYYCFTCYKVFETSLDTHVINHKDIKILEKEPKKLAHIKKSNDTNNNNSAIMAILGDSYEEHFNFNVKNNTATCKICQEIVKADFRPISQHRAIHATSNYIYVDSGKKRKELKIYGNKNYIKLNEGGSKGYCSICNMYMSGHINVFKQHVEGAIHRGHLELKGLIKDRKHKRPTYKGVPFRKLIKSKVGPIRVDESSFFIINDVICLEKFSFQLINFIEDFNGIEGRCLVCDITLSRDDVIKHAKCKKHLNLFDEIMIIPTEIGYQEFIRQIKPGLYHCGCCNKIFPFWETVNRHLRSETHQIQRTKKTLLSNICVLKYMNPFIALENLEAYITLKRLGEFR